MRNFILSLIGFVLIAVPVLAVDVTVRSATNVVENDKNFASLDGIVTSVANGDLGDADTSYTYFKMSAHGYSSFSMSHVIEATTLTYEGSNDPLATPDASATWEDITSTLSDGAVTEFTATGSLTVSKNIPWSRLRIKRVTTNATNSLTLVLTRTKL